MIKYTVVDNYKHITMCLRQFAFLKQSYVSSQVFFNKDRLSYKVA